MQLWGLGKSEIGRVVGQVSRLETQDFCSNLKAEFFLQETCFFPFMAFNWLGEAHPCYRLLSLNQRIIDVTDIYKIPL